MEQIQAIDIINVFDNMSEQEIKGFVERVKNQIQVGEADKLMIRLTAMEKIVAGVREAIKFQLLQEADMRKEKSYSINGHRIEKCTRKTYSYSHCQAWASLDEKKKQIESLMKSITEPVAVAETGEIIEPATWKTTEFIAVTLRKDDNG
jgi:hypothetical protein